MFDTKFVLVLYTHRLKNTVKEDVMIIHCVLGAPTEPRTGLIFTESTPLWLMEYPSLQKLATLVVPKDPNWGSEIVQAIVFLPEDPANPSSLCEKPFDHIYLGFVSIINRTDSEESTRSVVMGIREQVPKDERSSVIHLLTHLPDYISAVTERMRRSNPPAIDRATLLEQWDYSTLWGMDIQPHETHPSRLS